MTFRRLIAPLASLVGVSLIVIVVVLWQSAWPAMRFNGIHFLVLNNWNLGNLYAAPISVHGQQVMPNAQYGILFLIVGTLLSTAIAVLIAVPFGVGAAMFLAEGIPPVLRPWLSFLVELLAAIPSVVFGLWGYVLVIPFLGRHLFPFLVEHFGSIPFFGAPSGSGYGLLTCGLVLSLMIVPLIAATVRDALVAMPLGQREAALALGATRFETLWSVELPGVRRVIIASTILATGRALGETMAVLMVSGNALNYLPTNIYTPISTMASFIVSQLDSALTDPTGMAVRSLAEVALVLCLISIVVNSTARILLYLSGHEERMETGAQHLHRRLWHRFCLLLTLPLGALEGKLTPAMEVDVRAAITNPTLGGRLRRQVFNGLGWAASAATFLLLSGAMLSILVLVFLRGAHALNLGVFTHLTAGMTGGLLNAIEGTVVMSFGGILLAIPPGIAAGIYLSEFRRGFLAPTLRFLSDVLVGVPSIVVGYFAYATMVVDLGWHFSAAAASIALAIISLPYICRTTEVALNQVPNALREAGYALGANTGTVIMRICLPMAAPSILTGILLALSVSVGETAPLIYTAGWSDYLWTGHLTNEPVGYLTYVIWTAIAEPFEGAHALAYAAAFLVTFFVLLIGVGTRIALHSRIGAAQQS